MWTTSGEKVEKNGGKYFYKLIQNKVCIRVIWCRMEQMNDTYMEFCHR